MDNVEVIKNIATEYQEMHFWWEWQIPVYLFLGGIVAGLMILTSYRVINNKEERSEAFKMILWMVPVLLSLGMFALFLDLSNRLNVLRFYMAFEPSAPMSWGAWILLAIYPIAILFALGQLPDNWRKWLEKQGWAKFILGFADWAKQPENLKKLAIWNIALGIGLGIYTGILLGNISARVLWNTAILGPLFLTSGLSTGAAFMMLFKINDSERHFIGKADIGFIVLELILLGLFIISMVNGSLVQQEAIGLIITNSWAVWFWSLVIIAGLAFPLVAELWEMRGGHASRWFAPIMILVGGFALRWILVFAGQVSSW